MSRIDITGLEELENELKNLANHVQETTEEINSAPVSFNQLFIKSFMKQYTNSDSFENWLSTSKFNVESQKDFDNIPKVKFNEYVARTTNFSNWDEMLGTAVEEYATRKLDF